MKTLTLNSISSCVHMQIKMQRCNMIIPIVKNYCWEVIHHTDKAILSAAKSLTFPVTKNKYFIFITFNDKMLNCIYVLHCVGEQKHIQHTNE